MSGRRLDPHDRPLVVEFVGPPGGGKTTLLPVVAAALRQAGLTPFTVVEAARPLAARTRLGRRLHAGGSGRRSRQLAWALYRLQSELAGAAAIPSTWPLAWRAVRSQLGRPAAADAGTRRVLHWLRRVHAATAHFRRHGRPGEVLVLDEGYVHRVVQLFASGVEVPARRDVEDYLATVPVPDLLVAVRTPVETCTARIRARGVWSRLRAADGDELEQFVVNAHRAASLAVDVARQRGWRLVEIDNDGVDPRTVAATLEFAVASHLPAATSARAEVAS
ncbi:hypothetical protein [Egicoccus sp. AB-alg2]|uniref:hypothetical protein n=1 Tax=Egicoccus sp. AB-alg2 TaxID=3242693 RepID=UPI00359DAA68